MSRLAAGSRRRRRAFSDSSSPRGGGKTSSPIPFCKWGFPYFQLGRTTNMLQCCPESLPVMSTTEDQSGTELVIFLFRVGSRVSLSCTPGQPFWLIPSMLACVRHLLVSLGASFAPTERAEGFLDCFLSSFWYLHPFDVWEHDDSPNQQKFIGGLRPRGMEMVSSRCRPDQPFMLP